MYWILLTHIGKRGPVFEVCSVTSTADQSPKGLPWKSRLGEWTSLTNEEAGSLGLTPPANGAGPCGDPDRVASLYRTCLRQCDDRYVGCMVLTTVVIGGWTLISTIGGPVWGPLSAYVGDTAFLLYGLAHCIHQKHLCQHNCDAWNDYCTGHGPRPTSGRSWEMKGGQ